MKLAQRIAFGYYKTKFKTLGAVSARKAAEAAFKLFCTPYHGKPKRIAPAVFDKAEKLTVNFEGLSVYGFQWKNAGADHKRILICHGFDSCCYKFEDYIPLLLEKGFDVYAFDAPGHGISDGKTINALIYSRLIIELEKLYGPFYAIMAHSFGGLALSLAMEKMQSKASPKIVLIAPSTETSTAVENFFRYIPVPGKVRKELEALIFEIGGKPYDWYSVTRAIQNISSKILWLHDKTDQVCSYEDTKTAQQLKLPNVQFLITNNLGHSNIYRDAGVQKVIVDFFDKDSFNVKNVALKDGNYEWM